jgi:hypothetical protein
MNKAFIDLLNQAEDLSGPMREVYEAGMVLERENEELRAKLGDMQRLAGRAHSILSETWEEHTDKEGYGPVSLLKDLEKVKDGKEYKDLRKFTDSLIKITQKHEHEIAEMRAHVERLRKALLTIADQNDDMYPYVIAEQALEETPAQSLREIQREAMEKMRMEIYSMVDNSLGWLGLEDVRDSILSMTLPLEDE